MHVLTGARFGSMSFPARADIRGTLKRKKNRDIKPEIPINLKNFSARMKIMLLMITTTSQLKHEDLLNHRGRVTMYVSGNYVDIGSDNGLAPVRRQAITWSHASTGPQGINYSDILIKEATKMRLKISPTKCRLFCFDPKILVWLRWCS